MPGPIPATPPVCPSVVSCSHPEMNRPSSLLDTRVVYCGDNLEQLKKLPDAIVDLVYIQMEKVGRPDIDKFQAAMMRARRKKGFFVGFDFTSDALSEIGHFFQREHIAIVPLTVREILDETIAIRLV